MNTLSMNATKTNTTYAITPKTDKRIEAVTSMLLSNTGTPELGDARLNYKVNLRGETIVRFLIAPGQDIQLSLSPDESKLVIKFENDVKKILWEESLDRLGRFSRFRRIRTIQRAMLAVKKDYLASF